MRTAKEWRREIGDQCGSRAGIYTDEEIAAIQNEAIAHGMTLSAEIIVENNQPVFDLPTRLETRKALGQAILTARDNKIWRKE